MTELEAIVARHSVRQFTEKPIEAEKISKIQSCIDECNAEGGLHIQLVTNEPTAFQKGLAKYGKFLNVCNYLAVVAPKGDKGDESAGYYGERLVLLMQALELNSVWVGLTFKDVKQAYSVAEGEALKAVIAFGYGASQGVQHPQKKTFDDVAKADAVVPDWFRKGVETALLAPTALHQQKFEFVLQKGNQVEAKARFALNPYTHIDLGIVKYHFEIGAGRENFTWA